MATITTTLALAPRLQNFDAPNKTTPFAIAEFIGSVTVPAKLAADISVLSIILTFADNFVYKISTLNIHYLGTAAADLTDLIDDMTPGIIGQGFANLNQNFMIEVVNGTQSGFRLATADFIQAGHPIGDYQVPLRTGLFAGDNSMLFSYLDTSADATTAITVFFRMRCLQYTIEAFRTYQMFDAVPTITP